MAVCVGRRYTSAAGCPSAAGDAAARATEANCRCTDGSFAGQTQVMRVIQVSYRPRADHTGQLIFTPVTDKSHGSDIGKVSETEIMLQARYRSLLATLCRQSPPTF